MTPLGEPEVEAAEQALLDAVLSRRSVRTLSQPLVALDSGAVVAFEALSRGPAGSSLERPDPLFAAARRAAGCATWTSTAAPLRWPRWTRYRH